MKIIRGITLLIISIGLITGVMTIPGAAVTYNNVSSSTVTVTTLEPTPATVDQTLYGVTTSSTSVRTGAHVNYSVYATMPTGYKMAITGVAGTFYRVTYNDRTGYISSSDVTILEPTPPTVDQTLYGVTTSSTSVRTG
ncbi:MAG TPA: SH3 domain-containing protein, partial [Clostridium sp.]